MQSSDFMQVSSGGAFLSFRLDDQGGPQPPKPWKEGVPKPDDKKPDGDEQKGQDIPHA